MFDNHLLDKAYFPFFNNFETSKFILEKNRNYFFTKVFKNNFYNHLYMSYFHQQFFKIWIIMFFKPTYLKKQ